MKFDVTERDIHSHGSLMTRTISISANRKAYRLIFGQIYPDIIKAIVRELFTNAWDSQKVAGNLDTPIDIHLPTDFEPWFSIRDYGMGMTPQLIDDVYTKVFESTKDDSNDEAGMFGMGSKTPLGYTDSFAVTSYVNGIMRAYDIYINSSGGAQLDLKYEGETSEPNGVYVQVGVKKDDFESFKKNAELFALHAGTAININKIRVLNTRQQLMSGMGWTLYQSHEEFDDAIFLRMGCVLYKLNTSLFYANLNLNYDQKEKVKRLFDTPLVIDFDIGSFDVTGSREDIIYNTESASKIYDKIINDVYVQIYDLISIDVKNSPTFEQAYRKAHTYLKSKIINNIEFKKLKWKSWNINRTSWNHRLVRSKIMVNPYAKRSSTVVKFFHHNTSIDCNQLYDPDAISYVVLDNDQVKRTYSRMCNLVNRLYSAGLKKMNPYSNDLTKIGKPKMFNIIWVKSEYSNLSRLKAILPENHIIIDLNDIETCPTIKREKAEKNDRDYDVYHINDTGVELKHTKYTRIPKSGYYVLSERNKLVDEDDKIRGACADLGIVVDDVCIVNKTSFTSIAYHNLINLHLAAEAVKDSVRYNASTVFYHVMDDVKRIYAFKWIASSKSALAFWLGVDYNEDDVVYNYSSTVNQFVQDEFEQSREIIVQRLEQLFNEHPILQYVEVYKLGNDKQLMEIMKLIGEIE